jgi:putative PIN family toxin of toxin-antitoxin system
MIKAVLDSSVLFSAFLKPGSVPATLLTHAREGAFSLYLSSYILEETAAALLREKNRLRYSISPDQVARYYQDLMAVAQMVSELPSLEAVPHDPKDNPIVATAVAAKANFLITGDRQHLLPLDPYQGIRILSPRHFLDLIEADHASKHSAKSPS